MKRTKITMRKDQNGNKITCFQSVTDKKGFSVQTNGNLPMLHREIPMHSTLEAHNKTHLWKEFLEYVEKVGTDYQKSFFEFTP
jgi:hypothetical protein